MAWDAGAIVGTLELNTSPFTTGVSFSTQLALEAGRKIFDALAFGTKLAADYEQSQIALTALLGDGSKAQKLLDDIQAFANATPFESGELIPVAKMLANTQTAENIVPTLKMLGDVASGTATPIGQLAFVYNQVATQGRAMTQDLYQFSNAGIPIFQLLQQQLGVGSDELRKMVEAGKIGFPQIQAVFQSLTAEGGKYHNLTQLQSQSLAGLWSSLKDNASVALRTIAQDMIRTFDFKGNAADGLAWLSATLPGALQQISAGFTLAKAAGEGFARMESVKAFAEVLQGILFLVNKVGEGIAYITGGAIDDIAKQSAIKDLGYDPTAKVDVRGQFQAQNAALTQVFLDIDPDATAEQVAKSVTQAMRSGGGAEAVKDAARAARKAGEAAAKLGGRAS